MQLNFKKFRITTNGKNFRVEGLLMRGKSFDEEYWIPISSKGYYGCEAYGYVALNGSEEFATKDDAIGLLREEFGETGVRKMLDSWWPC